MDPSVPPSISSQASRFLELLDLWNATHSLTALPKETRFEELVLDACALLPHLGQLPAGARLVDFGTGMGIPSIILALARPDLQVVALDKSKKKAAFVRQAALELGLHNLTLAIGRAEELTPLGADLGTAKAVGSLELLAAWWLRHGKAGAPLLLPKGSDWDREPCPAGWDLRAHAYHLPTRGDRVVLQLNQKPVP